MPKKIKVKPEEWVERRKQGIGGSDVAAILRLHPYKSIFDVWAEKCGIEVTHKEHQELDKNSIPMRCGVIKEPLLQQLYEEHTGLKGIRSPGFYISSRPGEDWVFSNPDWIIGDPIERGAEFKCVSPYLARDWEDGSAPLYYVCQALWYQRTLEVEQWDIAGLIGDAEFPVVPIYRDQEFEREVFEQVEEFWLKNVKERIEPDIDSSSGCRQYLQSKYKKRGADVLEVPEDHPAVQLMIQYRRISEAEKLMEREKELVRSQLLEAIGFAQGIRSGPLKASHSCYPTSKVDHKAVLEEIKVDPEIIKRHTTTSETHRVLVTDARVKQKRLKTQTIKDVKAENSQKEIPELE